MIMHHQHINASVHEVFHAVKTPELLAQWWGPHGFTNTFSVFEFRPDGQWLLVMHGPDGRDYPNHNVFKSITPNQIVIRHDGEPYFTGTLTIQELEGGARVTWDQDFDDKETEARVKSFVENANRELLERLKAVVERQPAA